MRARMRLDIAWSDLAAGLAACLAAGAPARRAYEIESRWSEDDDALACLSVRSGLDLYLAAAELPEGSEVLVSALTIPDVPRLLEQRGLVPVPVDLEPSTLAPGVVELENARTPRTRALLLAHLFGERLAVEPFAAFARERGLELWEDCAQTYSGDDYRGHDASTLSLFSFGTIKTATALGGALVRVRDAEVLARMRRIQGAYPRQPRREHLARLLRASALHALSSPRLFGLFARAVRASGRDLDDVLHASVRGFPGEDFLDAIRRAPSAPLLALLARRLESDTAARVARRRRVADRLSARLPARTSVHGPDRPLSTHWVYPVRARDPEALVRRLRGAGFDATRRSSLTAVEPGGAGRPPVEGRDLLEHVVFVPLAPDMDDDEIERLAAAFGDESSS